MDQSRGFSMEIGTLCLSQAMFVLAELIVCSTRGFACILAMWFWSTGMSLSLTCTYGSLRLHVSSEPTYNMEDEMLA